MAAPKAGGMGGMAARMAGSAAIPKENKNGQNNETEINTNINRNIVDPNDNDQFSGTNIVEGIKNFYNLVERGQDAIEGILEIAKESDHPRTYEVAGNLIKQVAEVTEKLGDLQEKMRKLKEVPNTAPKNVTNALFVGSTAELQKMLKGKSDE